MGVIFETKCLILRTWTLEDAGAALRLWGDAEVMRFVGNPLRDLDAARRTLTNAIAAQDRLGFCLWAVVEKSSGEVIGCCGFHLYENGPALELAYHFIPSAWGRGYATEAAAACVKYAFDRLNRSTIVAGARPGNAASERVLEKIGMKYKGRVIIENEEENFYELTRPDET